jgi:hypothetical protein
MPVNRGYPAMLPCGHQAIPKRGQHCRSARMQVEDLTEIPNPSGSGRYQLFNAMACKGAWLARA